MSIGIFGDSFAKCKPPLGPIRYTEDELIEFEKSVLPLMPTWASLLPDTTNHALGGTDVSWSFLELLDHHEKYDKIIFIITDPNRIALRTPHLDLTTGRNMPNFGLNISAISANQALDKKQKFDDATNEHDLYARDAYDAINKWQTHIQMETPERDWLHYGALINELQRIRPDIKLIKAFDRPRDSGKFAEQGYYPYKHFDNIPLDNEAEYLYNIVLAENSSYFEEKMADPNRWWDIRAGHICTESHVRLFKIMKNWLQTNDTWLNFDVKEFCNDNVDADDSFIETSIQLPEWQTSFLQRRNMMEKIDD